MQSKPKQIYAWSLTGLRAKRYSNHLMEHILKTGLNDYRYVIRRSRNCIVVLDFGSRE